MFDFLQINKSKQSPKTHSPPKEDEKPTTAQPTTNVKPVAANLFQSLNVKTNNNNSNSPIKVEKEVLVEDSQTTTNEINENDPNKRVIKKVKIKSFKPGQPSNNNNDELNTNDNSNNNNTTSTINPDLSQLDTNNIYADNYKNEDDYNDNEEDNDDQLKNNINKEQPTKKENLTETTSLTNTTTTTTTTTTTKTAIETDTNKKDEIKEENITTTELQPKDPPSILDCLIDELKNSQYRFYEKLTNIENDYKQSLENRKKSNQLLLNNINLLKEYEEKENQLVENEDYEGASKVSDDINSIQKDNEQIMNDLIKLIKNNQEQDQIFEELLITYQESTDENQIKLLDIKSKEDENINKYQEQVKETIKSIKDEIEIKQESIDRETKYLLLDKEILETNETSLTNTINELNKPLIQEREGHIQTKQSLQDEIDKLLLEIQLKRDQQSKCDQHINEINEKIDTISSSKFSKEQSRLEQERLNIKKRDDHIIQLSTELLELTNKVDQLNNPSDHPSFQIISSVDETIKDCKSFLLETTSTLDNISLQQKQIHKLYKDILQSADSHKRMQSKLTTLTQSIQELTIETNSHSSQKIQLKKSISELEDTIPLLEQSKNIAKDSKRFTEAASLLSELKQKQQLLIEKNKQLQEISDQLDLNTTKLDSLQKEHTQYKEITEKQNSTNYLNLLENLQKRQLELQSLIDDDKNCLDKLKQFYKLEFDSNSFEISFIKLKLNK
ncbi:UvrB/UvrC domain-containing protein [Dictyostelium discoideum AX4]|uniref:UvrB/UvrC domain-containing protein n=1 Tax=Dictyostelium discoideum TaxID=44689 RepID=Q550K0_DICDI|nr:UvrB/UvrC domain-containing protein [Dictyostelium discoideum AX4]EAL69040.1 UvrB/UvrC domain-containing protein [Dictyostelium discoideum AX4]|eukprot:XP_642932.1 UvrB/UvrC domain-containing protein [Dictyostelium discoideum AX4]